VRFRSDLFVQSQSIKFALGPDPIEIISRGIAALRINESDIWRVDSIGPKCILLSSVHDCRQQVVCAVHHGVMGKPHYSRVMPGTPI
jgi:hypothetical protein